AAPQQPGCEMLTLCGRDKFLCVALDDPNDKFDQTLAEIQAILGEQLMAYDQDNGTQFSPLPPLAECGP
ncbi:MAG: hypothetical protein AAGA56_05345, partial [Myxococcota bacterium]